MALSLGAAAVVRNRLQIRNIERHFCYSDSYGFDGKTIEEKHGHIIRDGFNQLEMVVFLKEAFQEMIGAVIVEADRIVMIAFFPRNRQAFCFNINAQGLGNSLFTFVKADLAIVGKAFADDFIHKLCLYFLHGSPSRHSLS